MEKRLLTITICVLLLFTLLVGCSNIDASIENNSNNGVISDKITVYTTFYPMYFIAHEITGEKAEVINLTPAGVEPHDWEPTAKTIASMYSADMFIYNGINMEKWVDKVMKNFEQSNITVVCASDGIPLITADKEHVEELHEHEEEHKEEHNHGQYDPHIWVSPKKYKQQATNIYNALVKLNPQNKDYYSINYQKLYNKLDKLDEDFRNTISKLKSNTIVTSHDAFGYLAHDYNLEQIAIRGITPSEEPSPAKMAELVRACREHNTKYIFFEKLVSSKLSETLANEVGAGTMVLNAVNGVDGNSGQNSNYITLMYENLENIKKALGD